MTAPSPSGSGKCIGGFTLGRLLGEGASGRVFESFDKVRNKPVAVKWILQEIASIPRIAERLRVHAISPPVADDRAVVGYDAIVCDGWDFLLVMDRIEAQPLNAFLAANPYREPARIVTRFADLLGVFDAVHRRGFVHGNLKPGNLMILPDGSFRVLDLYLTRILGFSEPALFGHAAYMPPEQAAGREPRACSDIYSLAAVLKEILHPCLEAQPALLAVISKATEPAPESRFATATAFRSALLECPLGASDAVVAPAALGAAPKSARRADPSAARPAAALTVAPSIALAESGAPPKPATAAEPGAARPAAAPPVAPPIALAESGARLRILVPGAALAVAIVCFALIPRGNGTRTHQSPPAVAVATSPAPLDVSAPSSSVTPPKASAEESPATVPPVEQSPPQTEAATPVPGETPESKAVKKFVPPSDKPRIDSPSEIQASAPSLPVAQGAIPSAQLPVPDMFIDTMPPPPAPAPPAAAPPVQPQTQTQIQTQPDRPLRVPASVQRARLLSVPALAYPPVASQKRIDGAVRLEALIGADGHVQSLRPISGHAVLVDAAIRAVRAWVYAAVLVNGKPVPVITEIEIVFTAPAQRD